MSRVDSDVNWTPGNAATVDQLMLREYARLRDYIVRYMPDSLRRIHEPQDLLHDTYFEAFQRLGQLTPEGEDFVFRFLVTISRRKIAALLRLNLTQRRGEGRVNASDDSSVEELLHELASYRRSPSQSAMSHELVQNLEAELDRLPAQLREALRLRYLEDLPVRDIACAMGLPESTIHGMCNRGLWALRQKLCPAALYA